MIRPNLKSRFLRTSVGVTAVLITVGVVLWVLFVALRPLPGRDVSIATGAPGSAYEQFAERYRAILARDGVRLRLVPTDGAVENLQRLRAHEVDVGFVQAGTTNEQESSDLVSLGTMFYEPLWVFCRCPALTETVRSTSLPELMRDRPNARISVGRPASATRPLALRLLTLNRVDLRRVQLSGYPPEEAARRLIEGELDVVFILSAWGSTTVNELLLAPGIELMGFKRADAYVALDPKFSKLVLPQGLADLATNRPPADLPLIASKASLIARRDLHPALQYLLLRAAMEVHSRPAIFQQAGEFPAPEAIDLPLSPEALHVYKAGPSILQRTLPFWLAELLQRLLIILLPIAGILYPLWSLAPRVYRWQMQRRIYRLYGELRVIERTLRRSTDAAERARAVNRFEELERTVMDLKMPQSFSEMSFNLRMHLRALRESAQKDN